VGNKVWFRVNSDGTVRDVLGSPRRQPQLLEASRGADPALKNRQCAGQTRHGATTKEEHNCGVDDAAHNAAPSFTLPSSCARAFATTAYYSSLIERVDAARVLERASGRVEVDDRKDAFLLAAARSGANARRHVGAAQASAGALHPGI
jgi:hypothetical protein